MEAFVLFAFTGLAAVGAALTAAGYAGNRRPLWLGAAVLLSIAAVVLGVHTVVILAGDDLIWRLDVRYVRTGR